jgi:CheY-like chemotaxis protein
MEARFTPEWSHPSPGGGDVQRAAAAAAGARRRLQPAFVTLRVLIADDNVDAAEGLREWLEAMGYEAYTAYDGVAALEIARRLRPDAILLDIAMPFLNGDEVCRRLRAETWAEDVLIVAVTGFSGPEERRRSLEAGFDFHFVKPVDPRDLRSLLQSL